MKILPLPALRVGRRFWIISCVIHVGAFMIGTMTAPVALPPLVSWQHQHPALVILQSPPPGFVGSKLHDRGRFSLRLYWHNISAVGLNCLVGLVFFPLQCLFAAAWSYVAGVTMYFEGFKGFCLRILPQGFIEIPVQVFISGAAIQAGWKFSTAPWKQKAEQLKEGLVNLSVAWLVVSLLLLPAAWMEVFVRPWLKGHF